MLEEANRDATMRLEMHQTQFLNLDQETRKVMDEVIKEHPSIMGKEFDFTNTGEEIEVVNHNLSDREYNYLKSKLNSNDKLVQATDFFNESLSDSYNSKLGSSRNYTKDDAAGRINVLSTLKSLDEWIKNDSNGIQRLEEKNNQPESRFQRGLSIILDTHLPIKTKA